MVDGRWPAGPKANRIQSVSQSVSQLVSQSDDPAFDEITLPSNSLPFAIYFPSLPTILAAILSIVVWACPISICRGPFAPPSSLILFVH